MVARGLPRWWLEPGWAGHFCGLELRWTLRSVRPFRRRERLSGLDWHPWSRL